GQPSCSGSRLTRTWWLRPKNRRCFTPDEVHQSLGLIIWARRGEGDEWSLEVLKCRVATDLGAPAPAGTPRAGQQGARPRRAPIGGPFGCPQTAPDRLPIQLQLPRDRCDRPPLAAPQPANLVPALSTDHRHLPGWDDVRSDGPCLRLFLDRHF